MIEDFIVDLRKRVEGRLKQQREKLESEGAERHERNVGHVKAYEEALKLVSALADEYRAPESVPAHLQDEDHLPAGQNSHASRGYGRATRRPS